MHTTGTLSAAVLLLSIGLAACATHGTRATSPVTETAPLSVTLHAPRPGLYSSGQPAAGDWPLIPSKGVTTVIDLRMPDELQHRDEAAEVHAAGMAYQRIPVDGLAGVNPQNARALADALSSAQGAVLVHCSTANRAGGLLALAQAQAGASAAEALAFGRAAGMKGSEAKVRELLGMPADGEAERPRP